MKSWKQIVLCLLIIIVAGGGWYIYKTKTLRHRRLRVKPLGNRSMVRNRVDLPVVQLRWSWLSQQAKRQSTIV